MVLEIAIASCGWAGGQLPCEPFSRNLLTNFTTVKRKKHSYLTFCAETVKSLQSIVIIDQAFENADAFEHDDLNKVMIKTFND